MITRKVCHAIYALSRKQIFHPSVSNIVRLLVFHPFKHIDHFSFCIAPLLPSEDFLYDKTFLKASYLLSVKLKSHYLTQKQNNAPRSLILRKYENTNKIWITFSSSLNSTFNKSLSFKHTALKSAVNHRLLARNGQNHPLFLT